MSNKFYFKSLKILLIFFQKENNKDEKVEEDELEDWSDRD
jgi:hypothetical protein